MRRRLLRIVVLLVLGAILNVAVAWGCAYWPPATQETIVALLDPKEPDDVWIYSSFATLHSGVGLQRVELGGAFVYRENRTGREMPRWLPDSLLAKWGTPEWRTDRGWDHCIWFAEGWPALALRCEMQRDAIRLGKSLMFSVKRSNDPLSGYSSSSHEWVIAFAPIWPGFAINTVFYAAVLWGLSAAPLALRRRRRIKRGLCPKCVYPVGDSPVCTECGCSKGNRL